MRLSVIFVWVYMGTIRPLHTPRSISSPRLQPSPLLHSIPSLLAFPKPKHRSLKPASSYFANTAEAVWTWSTLPGWASLIQPQKDADYPLVGFREYKPESVAFTPQLKSLLLWQEPVLLSVRIATPKTSAEVPAWAKPHKGSLSAEVHLHGCILEEEINLWVQILPSVLCQRISFITTQLPSNSSLFLQGR